jgi:(2R)-ethylmalonyl-CoA mutase
MDVVYGGIRFTPAEIVKTAIDENVDVIGLSILSGSHVPLVRDVVTRMKEAGIAEVPVVVGGIIPPEDERTLKSAGVAAVYTPKDFDINRVMADVVRIVDGATQNVA